MCGAPWSNRLSRPSKSQTMEPREQRTAEVSTQHTGQNLSNHLSHLVRIPTPHPSEEFT